jgi:hypothetical protein
MNSEKDQVTPDASASVKDLPPLNPLAKGGIFETPNAALADVRDYYKGWTGRLTDQSFQLSMALIASNWAVFGSLNQILSNYFAKLSIGLVVIGLWLTLITSWLMSEFLRKRINYAEQDPQRWAREFEESRGKEFPWPYTEGIDSLGILLRFFKTIIPITGGVSFFLALILA